MVVMVAVSVGLTGISRAGDEQIAADLHTLETAPLAPGQIELLTVSTFPDTVTDGDVLVRVRGTQPDDALSLRVNGEPVPVEQPTGSDQLIDGLALGANVITATVEGPTHGARTAELTVRNHPISGPVISGPHQTPFRCRTTDLGLGAPVDAETCWVPTTYRWFAFSDEDFAWHELADPSAPYPPATATTVLRSADPALDGRPVPFVARVETAIINRGVARIAVLDDPANRADPADVAPNWNGRAYHAFGQSCGVGYDQDRNDIGAVLGSPFSGAIDTDNALGLIVRLGEGDVVVHSTLTSYGNHCNPFVSIETAMMLKEHIAETYAFRGGFRGIDSYIGAGNSGGALQQYNLVNNAPGVLDAALPAASFADTTSLSMTTTDCVLFVDYFASTDLEWNEAQKAAVTGHNPQTENEANSICRAWSNGTRGGLDATDRCGGLLPEQRYHPQTNPTGARCTVADANANWLGIDPETGFANRPLDNVGVQYGLRAFNDGLISFGQFADLNRQMGGFDIDGKPQPERHAMSPETAAIVYRIGQVIGRGALAETPIIDFAPYLDLVPVADLNIHESGRPLINRLRVRRAGGGPETMAIWRGVVVPADGFTEIDAWVETLNAMPSSGNRLADVAAAKPLTSLDQCALGTVGGRIEAPSTVRGPVALPITVAPGTPAPDAMVQLRAFVPEDHELGIGPCAVAMPPVSTTRIAAGGPPSDDVIKCQRKPVDPTDYATALSAEQFADLAEIFPEGVCDWSKPSVGDVDRSLIWPSLGGEDPYLDEHGNAAPVELAWRVARS